MGMGINQREFFFFNSIERKEMGQKATTSSLQMNFRKLSEGRFEIAVLLTHNGSDF